MIKSAIELSIDHTYIRQADENYRLAELCIVDDLKKNVECSHRNNYIIRTSELVFINSHIKLCIEVEERID